MQFGNTYLSNDYAGAARLNASDAVTRLGWLRLRYDDYDYHRQLYTPVLPMIHPALAQPSPLCLSCS